MILMVLRKLFVLII